MDCRMGVRRDALGWDQAGANGNYYRFFDAEVAFTGLPDAVRGSGLPEDRMAPPTSPRASGRAASTRRVRPRAGLQGSSGTQKDAEMPKWEMLRRRAAATSKSLTNWRHCSSVPRANAQRNQDMSVTPTYTQPAMRMIQRLIDKLRQRTGTAAKVGGPPNGGPRSLRQCVLSTPAR